MINEVIKQSTITFGSPAVTQNDGTGVNAAAHSDVKFKNVFDNTLKSTESSNKKEQFNKNSKTETDNTETQNNSDADREAVKADRKDIRDYSKKTVKEAASEEVGRKDSEPAEKTVKAVDEKNPDPDGSTVVINLAGILGMQPEELSTLLESAGISANELAKGGLENVTAKITQLAGLNTEQENALSQLLNSALQQLTGNTEAAENTDVLTRLKIKVSDMEKQNGAVTEKASLKVMVQGSMQQGDTFKTAIAKLKIKLAEKDIKTSQQTAVLSQEQTATADTTAGTEVRKTAETSEPKLITDTEAKKQDEKSTETESKTLISPADAKVSASIETSAADSSTNTVNTLDLNQLQKKDISSILNKVENKVTVQAKEIINQVVENAKIINTPEKSEIVMELKPESLGKLSLKVVTEQGIVAARFVAESEQVKSILETNMQLLKDSLEKQGVNVQGFSVSVRQENSYSSGRQYENRNQSNGRRTASNSSAINSNSAGMFIQDTAERLLRSNLYRFGSSTINITA